MSRRTLIKGSAAAAAGLAAHRYARLARSAPPAYILDVVNVPVPDFSSSNLHPGVEVMLRHLFCDGVPFYQASSSYPLSDPNEGLIGRDDTVLIKVNGQWQYRGVTNSDVVRGVIQRILDHPEGFRGEVVIFENGQGQGSLNCDKSWVGTYPDNECHANAENELHSFQYLIDQVFADPRVSGYLLDPIRRDWIAADEHGRDGYRQVAYVSYPCFTTAAGTRVELMEGIWTGTGYDNAHLKLLNIPVFKHHGGSAITGALKHTYGILSMDGAPGGYHYGRIGDATGDMFTVVRAPDLNIIDCIWVSPGNLSGWPASNTVRTNRLLAGFDPVALDYCAGKQVLYPAGGNAYHDPDTSGDFIAFLTEARDRINANGGIRGENVTFDESLFTVRTADAAAVAPVGDSLRLTREGDDIRLAWSDGAPPYTVWRSESPDMAGAVMLTCCCMEPFYVDAGAAADGALYYYEVE